MVQGYRILICNLTHRNPQTIQFPFCFFFLYVALVVNFIFLTRLRIYPGATLNLIRLHKHSSVSTLQT